MNNLESISDQKPSIKRYSNVLVYLKDYYTFRKARDPQFNQDLWSLELGFKSTSSMYLISSGRRPLTLKFIDTLATYLELNASEKNHLILLASYNKTKSASLKTVLFDKILENLESNDSKLDAKYYFKFVSSSTMPVITVALACEDMKGTEKELCQILNMSPHKVKQDLISLEKMGLIKKNFSEASSEAFWRPISKDFVIPDDKTNSIMDQFHKNTLKESHEKLIQNDIFKRFRSILFPIDPKEHEVLVLEIENFLSKLKNKFKDKKMTHKHVMKLNLNSYPVSQIKK